MGKMTVSVAAALLASSGLAMAQAQAPASAPAQPAKAPSAEAQAAMERAQRLAANPMRVILQASKFKRKAVEPDSTPEVADPVVLRRTAARTESAPARDDSNSRPARAAPAAAVAAAPVVAAAVAPQVAAPPPPTPEPPPAKVMPAARLGAPAASSVPAIEAAAPAAAAPDMAKAVAFTALPIAPEVVRPTLVDMVEPDIPVRLLADSGRVNEVMADLSLRADGTVAEVTLLPPVPRSWRSYIMAALQKWRFSPLPSARTHRIQLVFDSK